MGGYRWSNNTVLADLTVDGTTVVVDETNNRLGVNTDSPGAALGIDGDIQLAPTATSTGHISSTGSLKIQADANVTIGDSTADSVRIGRTNTTAVKIHLRSGTDTDLVVTNSKVGIGTDDPKTDLTVEGPITLKEQAAADSDTAAYGQLWVKTASPNELYYTTDAGDDIQITSGTGLAATGDITGVTAGVGLAGGGSSGDVTLTLDLSELSAVTPTATDSFATLDSDGSTEQRTTITALSAFQAGSGLSASSGVLSVDSITAVGAVNSGSITSGFGSIDVGSSTIETTGNISGADITVSGGDLAFGNGQNATVAVSAVSGTNTAGKSLTISGGQGTGSGAGGDIIFQTANAGGSGSSANSLATAMTISDDLSATFAGDVAFAESSAIKCGSNAILSDSSGTMTLSNVDALDATTEATIEAAIDTLSNLTSVGTIGTGTWQGTAIARAYIANDAINGDKIADDAINSEHYADGSIDTDHIGDDQVTLAKMAGLARGALIVGDASGNPTALSVGSDNHVLTVDSNGDIGWEAASGGGTDLNGLGAAAVNVANDSIGFIDADDSNASKKESIADFITAVAGTGLAASSGQLTVSSANTATAMVTGGNLTAVDAAQQIIAAQVFS